MKKENKPGLVGQIGRDVAVKIGVGVIMFISGGLLSIFMAMNNGSRDGSEAKRQNDIYHPKVDTLRSDFDKFWIVVTEEQKRNRLYDSMQMEILRDIKRQNEIIYINALEGD